MTNSTINSVRIGFEDLRSLDFGSISGVYALVGPLFQNPVRQLLIHNTTNVNLIISYDGIADKSFIATGTSRVMDYGSNTSIFGGVLEQPAQEGVYVRAEGANPASGNIYVELIYAARN